MTCDKCGRPATVHVTQTGRESGTAIAHCCEQCAAETEIPVLLDEGLLSLVEEFLAKRGRTPRP